jgi:hypothetical protein
MMSQHDYVIGNDTAANVRADINTALLAIASNNSGASAPATTYANQWWYDSTNDILKIRAEANDAWISVAKLNQTSDQFFPIVGGVEVTATGTEINKLAGVTATTAELNYVDVTTLGTSEASKAVTAAADGTVKFANAIAETIYVLSGTALDPSNGTIQTKTLAANTTLTDSVAAGESMTLMIDDGTAYTITWPTTTWVNNKGLAPTLATTGYTVVALWKVGTTLYGALVGNGS